MARVLSQPTVLVDTSDRESIMRVSVRDLELFSRLQPGGTFDLDIEDETVVGCRPVRRRTRLSRGGSGAKTRRP